MAEDIVTPERLKAGSDYLIALTQMGFDPEGAMWTMRISDPSSLELSLFSSLVDRIGTYKIFQALFDAFDRAKTPKDFDPWLVALYSPDQLLYGPASSFVINDGSNAALLGARHQRTIHDANFVFEEFDGIEERLVLKEWVYRQPGKRRIPANDQLRQWRRFEHAISEVA